MENKTPKERKKRYSIFDPVAELIHLRMDERCKVIDIYKEIKEILPGDVTYCALTKYITRHKL